MIFPQKTPWLNENQKTSFGGTFSPISVVLLLDRLFPKTIDFTYVCTLTNHANFMKIDSKL